MRSAPAAATTVGTSRLTTVIGASALGTLFEWYDFFLYGALATHIAANFFSGVNETTGFIFALAGFAVGFLARPVGALIFGRLGDTTGRKKTFLVTLTIMGVATVFIGLIPGYAAIGMAAPIALVVLRILQGLAVGGEFAGAITYVCEHSTEGRRAFQTAFLPASAMSGLLLSLLVIAAVRAVMGPEAFADWGWRIPFVVSAPLLAVSLWIRLKLHESPVFQQMKDDGATSRAPLAEAFLRRENLRPVLIAFAAVAGQSVVFYTSTFYALYFLQKAAKVDALEASLLMAAALAAGAIMFLLAGRLCDRFGRRPVLLVGFALAGLLIFPLFGALLSSTNPALARAQAATPIVVQATRDSCSLQFDPVGRNSFSRTSCDIAVSLLANAGANYVVRAADGPGPARIVIGERSIEAPDPAVVPVPELAAATARFRTDAKALLAEAGYGEIADASAIRRPRAIAILVALMLLAALCNVPTTVLLAELFPARIRYTALALPQNLGNGWFGGFLPATAFAIVAMTGNIFAGLWYPVVVVSVTFVICLVFLPETRGRPMQ